MGRTNLYFTPSADWASGCVSLVEHLLAVDQRTVCEGNENLRFLYHAGPLLERLDQRRLLELYLSHAWRQKRSTFQATDEVEELFQVAMYALNTGLGCLPTEQDQEVRDSWGQPEEQGKTKKRKPNAKQQEELRQA